MIKTKFLLLVNIAVAIAAMQLVARAQTNPAAPAGAGRGLGGGGGFGGGGRGAPPPWIEAGYNDHQNMMDQLGIKALRPGKSGNNQTGPGFDEATANDWMPTMPDVLTMKDGTKITTPEQWTKRRAEILEDFEREVYGRIPANVPKVTWEMTSVTTNADAQTITKMLVGHVDNSIFTNISVDIRASFTVPANTPGPVPVLISFGGVGGGGGFGGGFGGAGGFGGPLTADQTTKLNAGVATAQADFTALQDKLTAAQKEVVTTVLAKADDAAVQAKLAAVAKIQTDIAMLRYAKGVSVIAPSLTDAQKTTISTTPGQVYTTFFAAPTPAPALGGRGGAPGGGGLGGGIPQQALSHGWGYGSIDPASIQADTGNNAALRQGIIGLVNKGQPRKPDDWGALRAWGWGFSRLVDYFEAHPDSMVNPKFVGVEGVSRYGKAAIVTEAFDERVGPALVASSGEGGAKLHRHNFGEAVENLTGDEYYWMAGNFLKYGASDIKGKSMNASDLPVDSHELIALCAPRPVFISVGVESAGDPKWIDAAGLYRAGLLATPVYTLLGKKGYGEDITDWVHAPLPPVGTLMGKDMVFRQHEGGHTSGPNVPIYFEWVGNFIKSPAAPAAPGQSLK